MLSRRKILINLLYAALNEEILSKILAHGAVYVIFDFFFFSPLKTCIYSRSLTLRKKKQSALNLDCSASSRHFTVPFSKHEMKCKQCVVQTLQLSPRSERN